MLPHDPRRTSQSPVGDHHWLTCSVPRRRGGRRREREGGKEAGGERGKGRLGGRQAMKDRVNEGGSASSWNGRTGIEEERKRKNGLY